MYNFDKIIERKGTNSIKYDRENIEVDTNVGS